MIKNIIFDLGMVLVDFHPEAGMRELGFSEAAIQAFNDKIFGGIWESCDERPISNEEIRRLFKLEVPGFEREVDLLWDNIPVVTAVYDYSYNWLKSLKDRGYNIYILSNFGKQAFETNSKGYDFLELADGKVISYAVSMIKPNRDIYEFILNEFKLNPSESVFIDDRKVNIEGAKSVGINGIVFENFKDACDKLEKLLKEK